MIALGLLVVLGACEHVQVRAQVADDLRQVSGVVRCTGAQDSVRVATYPRLLRDAKSLDDISRPWYYPRGFSPADMTLTQDGQGLVGEGAWQHLRPSNTGVVTLDFVTQIPWRNGTFGRGKDGLLLLGGWHPMFAGAEGPLPTSVIDYDIEIPERLVGFVGVTPVGHDSPRRQRGRFIGRFVPMMLAERADVIVEPAAIVVRPRDGAGARHGKDLARQVRDLSATGDDDAMRELRQTLRDGRLFAHTFGLPEQPLLVVVAPLRENMVEAFDGGFAVSDRAFRAPALHLFAALDVVPFELFLRFHRLAVWRAQLATLALEHTQAREPNGVWSRLAADAVAAALRQRMALSRYGDRRSAGEVLEAFAVIPEIESLIYAPQVAFVDAYFEAVDERRGVGHRLDDFDAELPRGKLLFEKLADLIGRQVAQNVVDDYLRGEGSWVSVASRHAGSDLGPYFAQWLGPYPVIDYALGQVRSSPAGVDVEVRADGPSASTLEEVIEVEIVDDNGDLHRQTRLGAGHVEFMGAAAPPARVEIDPRGRLVELWHEPGERSRFNNRDPARWRFLLNNINGLIAVTNQEVSASVDFTLRRVHDYRMQYDFFLLYDPESYGAAAGAGYAFGGEVTPLRLSQRIGLRATTERLRHERGVATAATQGALTAFYIYDDRLSLYSSFEGSGLTARLTQAMGVNAAGQTYGFSQVGGAALHLFPLSFYDAVLVRVRGDYAFGDVPPQDELRLGGRYTARGFEPDEVRGDRRGLASLEYRHALVVDSRTDLFGLVTLTRVEGAVFADAAYLPVQRTGCSRQTFYDVGYGVRFLGDILSVAPGSLAIDVGLPLGRCPDESDRFPLTVYLAFVQSYLIF